MKPKGIETSFSKMLLKIIIDRFEGNNTIGYFYVNILIAGNDEYIIALLINYLTIKGE
ncbi:hypothetical protein KHA93_16370 [Bacillus sp. FJAT-49732]|uniref:Uncharacterized protein n=1 Tax=Lederbergia citrisecunda TaxID=2833583 RepID=A0A942YM88_9BACI|nr:hypothetical protein [Lederbergia citrisecunda]MBS4201214.1 hypothetical protein [Lederbergia citrisecunda]